MKKGRLPVFLSSFLCSFVLLASPLGAVAEGPAVVPPSAPVIITEIQTGAATAGDEFIEIYNSSDSPIDITGWQVRYANAGAETTSLLTTAVSADAQPVMLPSNAYYTFHTASLVAEGAGTAYSAGLSKTDKTVALFAVDVAACQLKVADAVAWAAPAAEATAGEGAPVDSSTLNTKEKLLRRVQDAAGLYVDTNTNNFDFVMTAATAGAASPAVASLATPGANNQAVLPVDAEIPELGAESSFAPVAIPACTPAPDPVEGNGDEPPAPSPNDSPPSVTEPPQTGQPPEPEAPTIPPGNIGLKSPLLSELLPNPASPQTDKDDEFIELYNPNDAYFDLSGYVLSAGLNTKKSYVLPSGTGIAPHSFLALFSADTKLALSNSGSQVALADPLGAILVTSETYSTAKDGQSWVLANSKWQWTTKPTPNALNVVAAPQVKTASTKRTSATSAAKPVKQSGKPAGTNANQDAEQVAALTPTASTPVHPGVLALIAVSAVLYGAYEYRHDVANKLYQLRSNRAARRALRQSTQGR